MNRPEASAFFSYNKAKQAARQSVARRTYIRNTFDRFVRQAALNFIEISFFLLVFKLLGLISIPWYGVLAYPLLWWVCLFLFVLAVATYRNRRS